MAEQGPRTKWYRDQLVFRVRGSAHAIAAQLRDMADEIDREAEGEKVSNVPVDVLHTVTWGIANAHLDDPARHFADLAEFDAAIARGEIDGAV